MDHRMLLDDDYDPMTPIEHIYKRLFKIEEELRNKDLVISNLKARVKNLEGR